MTLVIVLMWGVPIQQVPSWGQARVRSVNPPQTTTARTTLGGEHTAKANVAIKIERTLLAFPLLFAVTTVCS